MIFAKKDKVILAVLRGRRNIKRAKDTLTDSEHPCEALHKNDEAKSAQNILKYKTDNIISACHLY